MIKIGDIIISNLFIGSTQVSKVYLGDVKVWPIPTPIPTETNYVTFTAQEDGSSIGLTKLSTNQTLEYSTDAVTWNTFDTSTNISLNTGDKVYVRGKLSANNIGSNYTQFKMSGKIAASGNTNSLWDYENLDAQLKQSCGYRLFYGCTSLTKAPELSATTLAPYCYNQMFQGCTSLTTAPELHATTLAQYCYYNMFNGCTSLTTAPELPANTLESNCYNSMFNGCSNLTAAPELPATTLVDSCYAYMFSDSTSLNYIKCLAVNGINTNSSTTNWVSGVAATGTFVKDPNATSWPIGNNGIPTGWVIKDVDTPYVTFTSKQDNSSVGLNRLSTNQTLEYSTDTVTWNTFNTSTNVSLNTGDKVYVRGKLNADNTNTNYTQFSISGKIAASGNTNSLWDYEDLNAPLKQACGYNLFYNCTGLIDASELTLGTSDTTLAEYCYAFMFWYCRSLTSAPALPAITLATGCYYAMLYDCTSLTVAPELHATMLADGCYQAMLRGCTSLTTAPELPATTLASYCYRDMFNGCSNLNYIKCLATDISATDCTTNWVSGVPSNGTFVKASSASWPTGSSGIPSGWTTQDA